ncbi:MAG: hypothetical protein KDK36_10385, partial [Leptospiraceae bacterium]|nr:hypothetical protein [Leptospiraceae bacterium]
MSLENTKSLTHDATPSWSGFNYQGKIGLYVALDYIIKHYNDPDFDQYSIEYEWVEDFSIKKGEDYISIHQVKNKKDKNQSGYINAIV